MGSFWKATGLALVIMLMAPAYAEDEEPDEPTVEAFVLSIRSAANKDSAAVDKAVIEPLRKAYAERGVLFIDLDLSSKATTHQGRLMLSALGLGSLYAKYKGKAGKAVIWDPYNERAALEITTKTKADEALAAVKKVLDGEDEEEMAGG